MKKVDFMRQFILRFIFVGLWFGGFCCTLFAQQPVNPNRKKRIVESLIGNKFELDYTGFRILLVDKEAQWKIDKNASDGFDKTFKLVDDQCNIAYINSCNSITQSTGAGKFRVVPLVNGGFSSKLVFKRIGQAIGSVPATSLGDDELEVIRDAPYIKIYSTMANDPNKELSANNSIELSEQTDPNAYFLNVPLTVKSNVIWEGRMNFPISLPPWASFSLNRRQFVEHISTREELRTSIEVSALNYKDKDDQVGITFKSSAGVSGSVADPGISTEFTIIRKSLNVKINGVDNQTDFKYIPKPPMPTHEMDTIIVPYYQSQTNFNVTGSATWGVFNQVELRQKYHFEVKEDATDQSKGSIAVLQPNFLRGNRIETPLLLFHKKGIRGAPFMQWKVAIIVQEPGYLDVEKSEIREQNPASGQIRIGVQSNLQWKAELAQYGMEDASWISLDKADYQNDEEVELTIKSPNYTDKDRRVRILLKAKNGHGPDREITFIQSPAHIRIIEPKQVVFSENGGSEVRVKVDANVPWTVSLPTDAKAWLEITEARADGFTLRAKENKTGRSRHTGVILQSLDGIYPADRTTPQDPNFVQQLNSMIALQVEPFPRMIFLAPNGQKQPLRIITAGGWYIEKLPNENYSWLGFPDTLFGNGKQEVIFSTIQDNTGKDIRKTKIRVRSQLSDLSYYDVEIWQIPDNFISVNTLVKDQLRVTFSAFKSGYKGRIFSEYGVMAQEITFQNAQEWVDVSILPTGNYLLYIYDESGTVLAVKKIVKM